MPTTADVLRDLRCPYGDVVTARLCGPPPRTEEAVEALRGILVGAHCRLAGHGSTGNAQGVVEA